MESRLCWEKRFFSKEHEDLSLTAYIIFKDNYLNGSGVKLFTIFVIYINYVRKKKKKKLFRLL